MQERELIERSKAGDEEAFSELMHKHHAKIYHLCLKMVRDEEIAQDLTQETFLHVFQHLSSFRMESSFYTWAYRIARNLTLNYLKKKEHYPESELKEGMTREVLSEEKKESDPRLLEAIETLPPKQKTVIELFEFEHLPQKEIAAQLGISPGTVRSRLHYARQKIREHLKQPRPEA